MCSLFYCCYSSHIFTKFAYSWSLAAGFGVVGPHPYHSEFFPIPPPLSLTPATHQTLNSPGKCFIGGRGFKKRITHTASVANPARPQPTGDFEIPPARTATILKSRLQDTTTTAILQFRLQLKAQPWPARFYNSAMYWKDMCNLPITVILFSLLPIYYTW